MAFSKKLFKKQLISTYQPSNTSDNANQDTQDKDKEIQKKIIQNTNKWIETVENSAANLNNKTPTDVTNLFCKDGILWGTVSQIIRVGHDAIKEYFEYFARIKGLHVTERTHNIVKVTDNVYINNAQVSWLHDAITDPLEARMTFIFRNTEDDSTNKETNNVINNEDWCIFELHSSELPPSNKNVKSI